MSHELHDMGVAQLAAALRAKEFSAQDAARHFLARIHASTLGAFLAVDDEATMQQARAADALLAAGKAPALAGVPIAHKDIFVTRDWPTTAGSRMLEGYRSPFESTVTRLFQEAGMVCLGKLSCDEFAMGSSNENCAYGPVKNPWDTTRVPGGSSGGSAAAVAARLTPAATGTDTGGSIRQPSSFCGVTGIKPTYGRASRYGMVAFASSLDQAGPISRSAEDCALLLSAMCAPDPLRDSTSLDVPPEDFTRTLNGSIKGLRIGLPREFFGEGMEDGVRAALEGALDALRALGAVTVDISLPSAALAVAVYYIIAPAEASSNLSRYDGVKFGHRARDYADLQEMYEATRAEGFGAEVKRRIMTGTYVLSHGYYDAYYLQAQKVRRQIADDFQRAFGACDVIAGPTTPGTAWTLGAHESNPLADYMADIYTLPASLAGLPAMSTPAGFDAAGLPVGMQLIGNYLQEAQLLQAAHQLQSTTDWHRKAPANI